MRKQWVWSVLLGVVIAIALIGSNLNQRSADTTASSYQTTLPTGNGFLAAPPVDAQRLLTDVEALSFRRFTEADRSRARDYIRQSLEAAGWTVQTQPFEAGINLYAERPGTEPIPGTVLLAAHYDTVERSPGADDNATAVATVLEAARLFGQQPTPRTLQLAFFDLEETGLEGSIAFAEEVADNLRGVIVLDMIGYACHESGCQSYPPLPITPPTDRGDFLAVIGDQGSPFLIESFSEDSLSANPSEQTAQITLPQILTLAVPTFGRLTPDLMRSDHVPFWRKGIGAVLVTDTANFRNPHYHQPSDTLETIDRSFFVGSAQRVVNAITTLLTTLD
ncbi:peptidase M28 [filamentous cyanobacterium CCP1]|nr:peptidase M28 [filamentous cyanobacterium CCP2]PSB66496.1 peptidase M28 [filamentous cyanobacterium CCP1]